MKNLKERWKRAAAIGLAAILLTAQLPVTVFAEEAVKQETAAEPVITQEMTAAAETPEQPETGTGDEAPVEAALPDEPSTPPEAADNGSGDEAEKQEAPEAVKTPAFQESRSLDGVKITVEAEEGVFPEGAVLSVEKVTAAEERKAEEAVEDKRPEEQNVAASYTYDIKVLDQDGKEIQPADETKVKVSFTLEEVADANLTTNVYHIVEEDSQNGGDSAEAAPKEGDNPENSRNEEADAVNSAELTAEKLEVETDGDTAIVETDGFSLYTVEFTYENKQYVLPGDSEVALSEILKAVGLSGEASAVEVSDTSLFSAEKNEGGEWIVTAHKAFSTKEWMKVIIDGVEYEITVTDDQEAGSWAELQAKFNNASTVAGSPTRITLTGNVTAGEGDTALVIPAGKYVTLDLNIYTIDRGLKDKTSVNGGNVITVSGNLTLIDSSANGTGRLTGGNNQGDGGGVYVDNGTFTMEGGTITQCSAKSGGGVYVDEGSIFTMKGGTIWKGTVQDNGGGVYNVGTFTMEGGTITQCSATGDQSKGGGVYVHGGTFTMKDGTITGRTKSGGGVYVDEGSIFTMKGGTIIGCTATNNGGGVYNVGTFTMEGGTITGCIATNNGGGVYVHGGTFTMKDGTISDCNAVQAGSGGGGGVYVDEGTFTMKGGTITGCKAYNSGGGVYVNSGGTFTMENGTISQCIADPYVGGGVYVNGEFTMDGGTITGCRADDGGGVYIKSRGTFKVSGTPVISGNMKGSTSANNVVLDGGKTISVNGALTSGAEIHVNAGKGVVVATGENYTLQASDADAFRSDRDGSLTAALDSDGKVKFFNPWGALQVKFNNASTSSQQPTRITLTGNVTAGEGDTALMIPAGKYVTLDLNGHTINANNRFRVITVKGNLTLSDNSTDHTGTITGGNNNGNGGGVSVEGGKFTMNGGTISGCSVTGDRSVGGGVYVNSRGTFTMSGGTISDCNAKFGGGGVCVDGGMFTMKGGTISNCSAKYSGGGVYNRGTFTMNNGTISDCSANEGEGGGVCVDNGKFTMSGGTITGCSVIVGGGGVCVNDGTFTMDGGTITGCSATSGGAYGGGVCANGGTFNMESGTITNCRAYRNGGGVHVSGTFNMSGGTIKDCSAGDGGGVCADNGKFTMSGGTITGCSAYSKGGGVDVDGYTGSRGTFNMTGGTISGCTATYEGGGVFVYDNGTFQISGAPVIRDNKKDGNANNVVLDGGKTISVNGALTSGAEIHVNAGKGVVVATGENYTLQASDADAFRSDRDGSLTAALDSDGKVKFFNPWGALQVKFNNASTSSQQPTRITLTGDVTADAGDSALLIPAGRYVTLDLNGHTIDRGLAGQPVGNNGNVITVSGNLTLTDSSSAHTGTITGGNNEQVFGGGVSVKGGTFTMTGGTISGCNAARGGGVNVDSGTFTMTGGTITGCNAYDAGGGVNVDGSFTMNGGTFTMTGGTITDCNATSRGGGVYVEGGGKFTMENGTITGCKAKNFGGGVYVNGSFTMKSGTISGCNVTDDESNGGGVYIEDRGTFKVSGTPVISGNMKGSTSANNVELGGKTISVNGALTSGAEIHVNAGKGDVVATGERYTLRASDADAFRSDRGGSLTAALDSDGKVKFFNPWGALQVKFNNASTSSQQPTRITLTGDLTADAGDSALLIPAGKYVTLDLSGNTIDRGLAGEEAVVGGNVITVNGNLTLTDSSAAQTGTITGGNSYLYGGVYVSGGNSTFTMNGGTISGCSANNYGGVGVDNGIFTMNNGMIKDCRAENGIGGGVGVHGTFTMNGGTIDCCKAASGGGVNVSNGTFTMNGGTISACTALSPENPPSEATCWIVGGGVFVSGGTFNMQGGIISDCTALSPANPPSNVTYRISGGGVYVSGSATFNISGTPVIRDNKKDVSANNVELINGKTITVTGALTDGAKIYIHADKGAKVAVPGTPSGSITPYTIKDTDAARFLSDSDGSIGGVDDGNVVLKVALPGVTLSNNSVDYNGQPFEPQISFEGGSLTKDTDYTLSYKKVVGTQETPLPGAPEDAGSYRLVVTGIGEYGGMKTADFTIKKAVIEPAAVTAPAAKDLTYTGASLDLIDAGSVSGNTGTVKYYAAKVTDPANPPAAPTDLSSYKASLPKATDAGNYKVFYMVDGGQNYEYTNDYGAQSFNVEIKKASYTNNTVSGNTKYGLAGTIDLKYCIAPGGSLGTMTVSDPDAVLEGELSLSGTVLSYKFKSLSENVGKAARVTVSVNNAPNYKDYEVTATLNVIDCDHAHTELRDVKAGNCTDEGYSGNLVCTECGSIIEYGHPTAKVPDAHDFDEGRRTKEPTTITKGETTYRCRRCGYEKVAQDIPCVEEEGKDYDDLRKDVEGLSGDKAPRISVSENEAGDPVETVVIGGEEVSKTVTDKDTGKETIVSKVWIGGLKDSYCYTGSAIKPAFHVYDGTMQLKEKTDYTVSYKNNKDAGTATVEIKFKGNYKDTKAETLSFTISKAELGKDIIAHEAGVAEKKSAQKPVPVLTRADTGKTVSSKYFDFSYSPDPVKAAGEYTVTITPKNGGGSKNYGGSTTAKIVVTTKDKVLSNAKVTFDKKSYAYTGSAVTPKYSLKLDGRTLTDNTDYKLIDICNNSAPGTATVIFEGMGGYVGTKTATFKISGKIELKDSSDFTFSYDASVPFAKGGAKPGLSVRDNRNNVNLKEGRDYTVSYSNNKSIAGTPAIKIKGKGNYKGTVSRTFTITQQDISKLNITTADQFVKKTKLKKASVTIYDTDGNKLSSGKDFIVGANGTPAGDENTGTVTVDVTGAGNYTGKTAAAFRYLDVSANIGKAGTKKIADQSYTGNAVKLSYADLTNVLYTGSKSAPKYLTPGTDFEIVSYSNNIKRGTAKVVLKGKGSYAGTKTLTFKIVQRKVDYTGKL